jgi:hypothetical protein
LHRRDYDGALNTDNFLAFFVAFSSGFVFQQLLWCVFVRFSFNYYGFCGFLILFYCNSQDVRPLFNCFQVFAFAIAFKRTLNFEQFFIWLLVISIFRLFHCFLSFFSATFLNVVCFFDAHGLFIQLLVIEIACLFHSSLVFFSFGVFKVSVFSSSSWF